METDNSREVINPNNMYNQIQENQIYEYSDFNPDTSEFYNPQLSDSDNNKMGMTFVQPDPPIIPVINSTPSTHKHMMPEARCYGRESEKYAPQIKQFINGEYRDSLYYNILSRKSPTAKAKRIFSNISRDELHHSKKWRTAYFLITGERYIPSRANIEPIVVPSLYSKALRERYIDESADIIKYRNFAASVDNDICLKKLATDISDDEFQHANLILDIMHNM
jgi:rubrerythrin